MRHVSVVPHLSYCVKLFLKHLRFPKTHLSCFCTSTKYYTSADHKSTTDDAELYNFRKLSQKWLDETGSLLALHSMNRLRVPLIRDGVLSGSKPKLPSQPLKDFVIVDVGCGAGILTEPLARLGASVTGLDAVEENIGVANYHAQFDSVICNRIEYQHSTAEILAEEAPESFDAVIASEVVEHVREQDYFVQSCCDLVKPGGSLFFTTINRTFLSKVFAVQLAEILNYLPRGTHDWEKFVSLSELEKMVEANGCTVHLVHGMMYNPFLNRWSWIRDCSINYALHAIKPMLHDDNPGSHPI